MVVCALILAALTYKIDTQYGVSDLSEWVPAVQVDVTGARTILSAIASSIIGVAGVTFSVSMLAVSFASNNYGPRLIGNFMRDRGSQVTLGVFISTFVFSLLILLSIQGDTIQGVSMFVPRISILVAVILVIICVIMLIYFIHHVPETINVENIAADLGRDFIKGIDALIPVADGTGSAPSETLGDHSLNDDPVHICTNRPGYIQTVETTTLNRLAKDHRLKIRMIALPGDFVTTTMPVLGVWSDGTLPDATRSELVRTFAIGDQHTKHQNVTFVAEQLVEIVARAMSPGINDPYTAQTCLNWLICGLEYIAGRSDICAELDANEHLSIDPLTFTELLGLVCNGTRQHIAKNRMVALGMIDQLGRLGLALPPGPRRQSVVNEVSLMADAVAESMSCSEAHDVARDAAGRWHAALA